MGKRPIAVAGIILSMLLGGCGGGEKPTEEPLPSEPVSSPQAVEFALPYYKGASLHPILGENRTNLNLVGLVYEGLFSLDNTFTPHEVLVRNWTVDESGLVYTFELKDTRFSDGSALTAAEAAASLGFKKADTGALEALVKQVIANSPNEVARIREGNMKLINALTGQVMKNSNPKPNPKLVTEILMAKLELA
jgi:ABC-type transport system substrate-binding protein